MWVELNFELSSIHMIYEARYWMSGFWHIQLNTYHCKCTRAWYLCVEAKIHIHHLNGIENLDANIENGQHSIYQRMLAKCLARPFHIKIVSNYPSHATNTLNETKQSTRSLVEYEKCLAFNWNTLQWNGLQWNIYTRPMEF